MVIQSGVRAKGQKRSESAPEAVDLMNGRNVVLIYQLALGAITAEQGAGQLGVSLTTVQIYCDWVNGPNGMMPMPDNHPSCSAALLRADTRRRLKNSPGMRIPPAIFAPSDQQLLETRTETPILPKSSFS